MILFYFREKKFNFTFNPLTSLIFSFLKYAAIEKEGNKYEIMI
jgi:hypothetical protein